MSTLWIAVLALAVVPGDGSLPGGASTPSAAVAEQLLVPPRTGTELRDAVRSALRRWARADGKQAEPAARELLLLYGELQADDELARSQSLELRTKLRSRLFKLSEQITKRVAIEKRLAKNRQPKSVDAAVLGNGVLAQVGGFGGAGGIAMPGFAGAGFGGPGLGGGMMGGGGPYGFDHGPELVDLIQQTISPQTWDVNGGLGVIYYWRPGRAMVIRQTGEVHRQIGGLLEQMGRMGR